MDGTTRLTSANITNRRVVLLPDGSILNRYWDDNDSPRPEAFTEDMHVAKLSNAAATEVYRNIRAAAESGWDFSSRWFKEEDKMRKEDTLDHV